MEKKYSGTVYIGVAGGDLEYATCRDSIEGILRRPGDTGPHYHRATKGYEARQAHINRWINQTHHEYALFLDQDMVFRPDTLERLRSHGLPFVSGLYMRRTFSPMWPVWYRPGTAWPLEPWIGEPERNQLHELGASGWGCMLMHRDVVIATRQILKNERDIIEDDMDVWPYDLQAIMRALAGLREIADTEPKPSVTFPALRAHLETLEAEIRPLRADSEVVGSDIRFPFYARAAGYKLWGDPEVRPGHVLDYPLTPDDYAGMAPAQQDDHRKKMRALVSKDRRRLKDKYRGLWGAL